MKHYCKYCNITHAALMQQDEGDETYYFCPTCKSDMFLINEDEPGFIDGAIGKKVLFTSKNKPPAERKYLTENEWWAAELEKQKKEDTCISAQLKQLHESKGTKIITG